MATNIRTMDVKYLAWLVAAVLWTCVGVAWAQREKILVQRTSSYNEVQVVQVGSQRILKVRQGSAFVEESRYDLKKPLELVHPYSRLQMLGSLFCERLDSALVVGLGGGSLSKALHHHYPHLQVDSIELDPEIARLARDYFDYREDSRSQTFISDAREFLASTQRTYDLIFLDAFDGLEIPQPLRTVQFYEIVGKRLRPGGVVVSNLHRRSPSYLRDRATLRSVFSVSEGFLASGSVVVLSSQTPLQPKKQRWKPAWGFACEPLLAMREDRSGSFETQEPFQD